MVNHARFGEVVEDTNTRPMPCYVGSLRKIFSKPSGKLLNSYRQTCQIIAGYQPSVLYKESIRISTRYLDNHWNNSDGYRPYDTIMGSQCCYTPYLVLWRSIKKDSLSGTMQDISAPILYYTYTSFSRRNTSFNLYIQFDLLSKLNNTNLIVFPC